MIETLTLAHPERGERVVKRPIGGSVVVVTVHNGETIGEEFYRYVSLDRAEYERTEWRPMLDAGARPYVMCLRCGSHSKGGPWMFSPDAAFYPDGCPNCTGVLA